MKKSVHFVGSYVIGGYYIYIWLFWAVLSYVQIGNEKDATFLQSKNILHLRLQSENVPFIESKERFVTLREQRHEVQHEPYCLC